MPNRTDDDDPRAVRATNGVLVTHAKIITLCEPYASLAAVLKVKRHETRGWKTTYRGPLYIHSAKAWGARQQAAWERLKGELLRFDLELPAKPTLGAVLGRCTLASCLPTDDGEARLIADVREVAAPFDDVDALCGDWSPRRFAFALDGMQTLPEPIGWIGSQGRPKDAPSILVKEVEKQFRTVPQSADAPRNRRKKT